MNRRSFATIMICILVSFCHTKVRAQQIEIADGRNPGRKGAVEMAAHLADSASVLLYEKWDLPAAKKMLDTALQHNPKNSKARADLAWYHVLFGRSSEALQEIENAARAEPGNPLWPAWHGWIYLWNEDLEAADRAVAESLRINPSFAEALHVKSKISVARGDFSSAIATHIQASSLDRTWSYALAHTYALAGKTESAREILNNLEHSPWNSLGRVKIYLALGETNKALDWLEKAYDLRHPYLLWCRQDVDLKEIWGTSEFREIYAKLGL